MSAPDNGDDVHASANARVGLVLNDKWTLEKLLGVGAMGAVYEGRHRNGARGAIKILHASLARETALRERFLREGYAANRVEHPGAVKVLDDDTVTSGPCEGSPYLVMELLVGESLQDRLVREEPVGEREFLLVASAVLATLEKAHANGVVHRDLKPENIFLLAEDALPDDASLGSIRIPGRPRVKVLDFGLARLLDAASNTHHGMALGTPSFMSPEQASGKNDDLDGRTDLFSLAASGFRLVAGRRVHEGAPHVLIQVTNMATLPAPKIKSVAPHVTFPFARVIDRALQFKREDRYADAAEMRADVEKALVEIEEIARNPTLADIPKVPELPASASAPTVKVALPASAPSVKAAAAPPLPAPSSKKLQVASKDDAPVTVRKSDRESADAAGAAAEAVSPVDAAIAAELEKEPASEPAPKKNNRWAWRVILLALAGAGVGGWFVAHAMSENADADAGAAGASASASASAISSAGESADASLVAPPAMSAQATDVAVDAGFDASDAHADSDDDDDAGDDFTIELDASTAETHKPAPANSAQKPHPKAKPGHPPTKPTQKPGVKKPPPPHHWW